MTGLGLIAFDDNGRLYICHHCDTCSKFPLEDINEPCLDCGISQHELINVNKLVERANRYIDLMADVDLDDIGHYRDLKPRDMLVMLSKIKLGDMFDEVTFTDIEQTNGIRKLADISNQLCNVIVYPTGIEVKPMMVDVVDDDIDYL